MLVHYGPLLQKLNLVDAILDFSISILQKLVVKLLHELNVGQYKLNLVALFFMNNMFIPNFFNNCFWLCHNDAPFIYFFLILFITMRVSSSVETISPFIISKSDVWEPCSKLKLTAFSIANASSSLSNE